MKNGKIVAKILIAILVLVVIFIGVYYFLAMRGINMPSNMKKDLYYKIVYITGSNKSNINFEYYCILDKDGKVIQTRALEKGYDSKELEERYSIFNNTKPLNFDAEKSENTLIYSTNVNNGKTISELKDQYQNNSNYSNVIIELK